MMLIETDFLIVKHEPAIGGLIREILTKNQCLIIPATGKKRQWQGRNNICRVIALNWPDPPDEGATGRFRYSVDDFIRQLETAGASVKAKKGAA